MSLEAWGSPDEYEVPDWYYTQTIETLRSDGWLDDEQVAALKKQRDSTLSALATFREAAAKVCDKIKKEQLGRSIHDQNNGPDVAEECCESIRALPIPPEAEALMRDASRQRHLRECKKQGPLRKPTVMEVLGE